jgi:hypothetical protein
MGMERAGAMPSMNEPQNVGEQIPWDGDLGHLECDIAPMADDLHADLDQFFLQACQGPVLQNRVFAEARIRRLDRARCKLQNGAQLTAESAERNLTAVMAVLGPAVREKSRTFGGEHGGYFRQLYVER